MTTGGSISSNNNRNDGLSLGILLVTSGGLIFGVLMFYLAVKTFLAFTSLQKAKRTFKGCRVSFSSVNQTEIEPVVSVEALTTTDAKQMREQEPDTSLLFSA